MYRYSKSCVKIDNCLTDFFPVQLGVKQRDNLRPNLFKIFINDLPDYLERAFDSITLNGRSIHCLMYADDQGSRCRSPMSQFAIFFFLTGD